MNFTNPVNSGGIPKFHEASAQRSVRDSDTLQAQWRKEQKAAARADALTRNMALMNRNIARIRRKVGGQSDLEQIRVQLCVDGVPTYYLLYGEVDPDQTP